jgi:uncharacterized protein YbbC (DUF1343 family)
MQQLFLILCLSLISACPLWALDYGIDTLNEPSIAMKLKGKRLAVLTHAAGVNQVGRHLIDLLVQHYSLIKIFAPEHGLRTQADDWVEDGVDEATGLPVISLYKRGDRAPRLEDLQNLDGIVIDLQDVGVRFYTYFSTIAEVMKVAARAQVEVIILDRPNLLGGTLIEGKLLDAKLAGHFIAYHTVPTRHGMTLGELARMLNAEQKLNCQLTVIPVRGWRREALWPILDRAWTAPSPALTSPQQVGLYALWGSLENFNLAVGRGQENHLAFRVLGAPWISPEEATTLSHRLNQLNFPGVQFSSTQWNVTRSIFNGQLARGVEIIWDSREIPTDEFTYRVALELKKLFGTRLVLNQLGPYAWGSQDFEADLIVERRWSELAPILSSEQAAFRNRRERFLLYPP